MDTKVNDLRHQADANKDAFLSTVFRHVPFGIAFLDCDLRYVMVNDYLAAINGKSPADHVGKSIHEIIPSIAQKIEPHLRKVLSTRQPILNLSVHVRGVNDSEDRFYEVDYQPVVDTEGGVIGINSVVRDVHEKKLAEDALRQRGEVLRLVCDNIVEFFWVLDITKSQTEFVSPAYERIFERPASELYGSVRSFLTSIHPEDKQIVKQMLSDGSACRNEAEEFEYRFKVRGNKVRWASTKIIPVFNKSGEVVKYAASTLDITPYKEKELMIESIASASPNIVYVFDVETQRVMHRKGRGYQMLGYGDEEMAGKEGSFYLSLLHPDDIKMLPKLFKRWKNVEDGQVVETEYRLRQKNGEYRWFLSCDIVYRRNPEGEVKQIVGTALDINERKEALEIQRLNDQRFRKYFELGLIGIAETSPEKHWVTVNDYLCRMLGYSREELTRKTWAELTYPEDLARDEEFFGKMSRGEIDNYELKKRYIRKDGSLVFASIAVSCIRKAGGEIDYAIALVQDITDRERADHELSVHRAQLEQLVRERTEQLEKANLKLKLEIEDRKVMAEALNKKHIALNEIINQIEVEKKNVRDQMIANVERVILPTAKKLRVGNPELREDYLKLLIRSIKELSSTFGSRITNELQKLTPREIEICSMVKSRLTNKDIARLLNISLRTVETHRNDIRKKLKLSHKKVNLATYLQSL